MTFDDLLTAETEESARAKIIAWAVAAGLPINNWIDVGVGKQILEVGVAIVRVVSTLHVRTVRGFASLETTTNPGDVDPHDPENETRTPADGFRTWFGSSIYGTPPLGETFATGYFTLDNSAGSVSRTFAPEALTITWTANSPPSPAPTYTNTEADEYECSDGTTIAANPDGTLTVPAGQIVYLPITAREAGARSTCPAGSLTLTTTMLGASDAAGTTNEAAIVGSDRETASAHKARCRLAPAAVSPFGPADGYRYIALSAQTDTDGNVFFTLPFQTAAIGVTASPDYQRTTFAAPSGTSLGIARVDVVVNAPIGAATVYLATHSGAPTTSVVDDIRGLLRGIYGPTDCVTRLVEGATNVNYTVSGLMIYARRGVSKATIVEAVEDALNSTDADRGAAFPTFPIGGYDKTAGAGTLYGDTVQSIIKRAHPSIYRVTGTFADLALAAGEVAVNAITVAEANVTLTTGEP